VFRRSAPAECEHTELDKLHLTSYYLLSRLTQKNDMSDQPERESIIFLFNAICRAQRGQLNDALTKIELYAGQEMMLWQLWREDGLTQSQMVERICVQPPTVSKMLDRLVSAGLVRRRPDAEDSRVSRVYLTEHGRDKERAVCDIWIGLERRMTEKLTLEERVLLRRLLLQVHENLSPES
jgi:DNA-binding MarR family transcriptional regulator